MQKIVDFYVGIMSMFGWSFFGQYDVGASESYWRCAVKMCRIQTVFSVLLSVRVNPQNEARKYNGIGSR